MRRTFSPSMKAEVAIKALADGARVNEIASKYEVHPTQVKAWKDTLKNAAQQVFTDKRLSENKQKDLQTQIDELHRVIGVRDAELEWLKKTLRL